MEHALLQCRQPGLCRVAVVAVVAGRWVIGCFTHRQCAVVTARARAEHLRVIDLGCGREQCRRMAVLADIRRKDVSRVLTDCVDTVVAAHAITGDSEMIEGKNRKP